LKTMRGPGNEVGRIVVHLTEEMAGSRLDRALARLVDGHSRVAIQKLIRAGAVRVDGEVVERPGTEVEGRARVEIDLDAAGEAGEPGAPEPSLDLRVVHEDEHLIAVEKPAGMLTHAASPGARARGGGRARGEWSAADVAARRFGALPSLYGEERGGIVHRLDRDTSGLLLLGRTREALEGLKSAFQARAVEKTYLAIVRGSPRFDSEWIVKPLGRSRAHRDRIGVVPEGEGREASTYYEVRERFDGYALLAVFPKTGRTHQVRVHLASIGMPLLGERLYVPRNLRAPVPVALSSRIGRQALHAHALALAHPITEEALRFESPLPADMASALGFLREKS